MKVTRKRVMVTALIVLGVLAALQMAGALIAAGMILRPTRWPLADAAEYYGHATPADFRRPFSDMEVAAGEVTIKGWLVRAEPPSDRAVILLHQLGGNRVGMLSYLPVLDGLNANVVLIDLRAHGESDGRYLTYGAHERKDVKAVVGWLIEGRLAKPGSVALIGQSLGGAIALQTAAVDERVGAVVADGAFADLRSAIRRRAVQMVPPAFLVTRFGTWIAEQRADFSVTDASPQTSADQVRCPVLLIHGSADPIIPAHHAEALNKALTGEHELWLIPDGGHCDALEEDEVAYTQRVRGFLERHLK